LSELYLSACDEPYNNSKALMAPMSMQDSVNISPSPTSFDTLYLIFVAMKKKYKPVALKVHPVITDLPDRFHIIQNIISDPLENMPLLNPHPPSFTPSSHYNAKQKAIINKNHPGNFLWPEEHNLLQDFIQKHKTTFTWNKNKRRSFQSDFFPPIEFPIIPHTPWVQCNIPIPPRHLRTILPLFRLPSVHFASSPYQWDGQTQYQSYMTMSPIFFSLKSCMSPFPTSMTCQSKVRNRNIANSAACMKQSHKIPPSDTLCGNTLKTSTE
jgi:hypothetical protein